MKWEKEKYFSCYSPNLKNYLVTNGFDVIASFVHVRENKTCWVFERTGELCVYLEQWTDNKKNLKI